MSSHKQKQRQAGNTSDRVTHKTEPLSARPMASEADMASTLPDAGPIQELNDCVGRLRHVLNLHFDPRWGSTYWIEQRSRLGFDPREEIKSLADLTQFPVMDQGSLACRPLEDFIPRRLLGVHSKTRDGAAMSPSRTGWKPVPQGVETSATERPSTATKLWHRRPAGGITGETPVPRVSSQDTKVLNVSNTGVSGRTIDQRSDLLVVQTGGTSGRPVWSAYTQSEFHAAFVEPFRVAARHVGFPDGGRWLYVGPSGPHVIARAAEAIARQSGAMSPFMIDFDARWAKKLPTDSFAARRYLTHIVDQCRAIIEEQYITHFFTTPAILASLAREMTDAQRQQITGVHYGGMAIEPDEMAAFQSKLFPNAVHLSGYGNTLFGCCLELDISPGRLLRYFPHGDRLIFGILTDSSKASGGRDTICYERPNASGRLLFSRMDESILLINFAERDHATLIRPPADAPDCFHHLGVQAPSPWPVSDAGSSSTPRLGLY